MSRPDIVMFSGGTGCRSINIALSERAVGLTRVVPAWDSGGSSKSIREGFGVLSIGDLRQALMTMAHGEGCAGDVVRICNTRLSGGEDADAAAREFSYFATGEYPLFKRMDPGLRGAILNYLRIFEANRPDHFDFRNGSIGNFILTGAYIAHNRDINTAIFVFKKICGIEGNVWPSTVLNTVELAAGLADGSEIARQHLITRPGLGHAHRPISRIELRVDGVPSPPAANEAVLEAIANADCVVFGPGSFYTSILPHLMVRGVVEALSANPRARRVLIGNLLECPETEGMTLSELLAVFADLWASQGGQPERALDCVLANRELFPFQKQTGSATYLANGDLEGVSYSLGSEIIWGEFEDPWQRGSHDGDAIAGALMALTARGI